MTGGDNAVRILKCGGRRLRRRCHSGNRCQLPAHGGRLVLTALLSLLAIGVCTSIRGEVLPGPEGLARKGQTSSTEQGLGSGLTDVPAAAAARGTPHPPSANAWHPDAAAQRLISCYNEQYATKLPYPTFDDLLNEELPRVWLHRVWWSPHAAPTTQHSVPQHSNGSATSATGHYTNHQRHVHGAHSGAPLSAHDHRPHQRPHQRSHSHPGREHGGQYHGQGALGVYTMASLDRLSQLEAQCRSVPGVVLSAAVYVPLLVTPSDASSSSTSSNARRRTSEGSRRSSNGSRSGGGGAGDGGGNGKADGLMAQGAELSSGAGEREEGEAAPGGGELGGAARRALQGGWVERFGLFRKRSWLRGVGPRGPQGLGQQEHEMLAAAEKQLQELYTRLQSSPTPTCRPVLLMFAELVGDAALAASMPTNTLRNAALLPLTTPLVLMADADLSVSSSLTAGGPGTATGCASPGGLLGNATKMAEILATSRDKRAVLVVPAFEASRTLPIEETSRAADMAVAGNKSVLQALWRGTQPPPVHPFDWLAYVYGHGPTDFNRFLTTDEPYDIKYGDGFEPWFIVARELAPPFDERFRGWNGDKVSQVSYTAYLKYKFMVLPAIWLVHRPHLPPAVRAIFKGEKGAEGAQIWQKVVRKRFWSMTLYEHYMTHTANLGWRQRTQQKRGWFRVTVGDAFQHCKGALPWWQDSRPG